MLPFLASRGLHVFYTASFSHCLVSSLKFHSHARLGFDLVNMFSGMFWLHEIWKTCENGEMKKSLGGSSLMDRHLNVHVFQDFLQQKSGKKTCKNSFFYTDFSAVFSWSWIWTSPNLHLFSFARWKSDDDCADMQRHIAEQPCTLYTLGWKSGKYVVEEKWQLWSASARAHVGAPASRLSQEMWSKPEETLGLWIVGPRMS